MLVLTRRKGESVIVDNLIKITVLDFQSDKCLLEIEGTVPRVPASVETTETPSYTAAYVEPGNTAHFVVKCSNGEKFSLENGSAIEIVSIHDERVKIGFDTPPHMRVDRQEIRERFVSAPQKQTATSSNSVPLVNVVFQDDSFSESEIELVFKYLSAVYREQGGSGLTIVTGQLMQPATQGVES